MDLDRDSKSRYLIKQGDICVIYISEHQKLLLKIEPNEQLSTKFGLVRAMDLLDKPYGVRYDCKRGWVLPLKLTAELWTQLLPHRTQILYQADISMILLQLDIKPGSLVVESGTGSGSLSHAIIRACKPNGYLYTFDINESRVQSAQLEFKDHGLSENVRVTQRNVCQLGYGDELIEKADACILDLPQTWDAIEHAHRILKSDGSRLCTFSPCIEQVKQNVAKMVELKMKDIVTLETLLRPLEVREQSLRVWSEEALDELLEMDKRRLDNIKLNLDTRRKMKKLRLDDDNKDCDTDQPSSDQMESEKLTTPSTTTTTTAGDNDRQAATSFNPSQLARVSKLFAKQCNETVSHSGFLTFATKRP